MLNKISSFIKRFYLLIIFVFLYTPIVTLMVFSFNDSKSMGQWKGFTLRWYQELMQNDRILLALKTTLLIAVIASVVATIIGTFAAIGIHKMRGFKKKALLNINYLPVLNPDIVISAFIASSLYVPDKLILISPRPVSPLKILTLRFLKSFKFCNVELK